MASTLWISMRRATAAAALALLGTAAAAQTYPTKPIRMIVPFPAGGPSDVLARVIGQKMTDTFGQQIVVDNRPGGNTIIGAEAVAKAAPDGYTLLMAIDSTLTMNQYLYSKLPYDPLKDFTPISLAGLAPVIIEVDAATGPQSVRELFGRAKANPGKLTYGAGTITTQLIGEMLKSMAGIDIVYVAYRGSAPTVQGLLTREVSFTIDGVTASVPHIESGTFRVLATTGAKPIAALPKVPPLASEPGFAGFDVATWLGLVAPAGTPAPVVNKLAQEIARIAGLPDAKEKLAAAGIDLTSDRPDEFGHFIRGEAERWSKVIKQAGIHLD
ncbi:MAG TPA: tripartite tricarboxylate transporter substrate binding protein [Alphaproteobacteria bacterium]